jgi:hypothetical protein
MRRGLGNSLLDLFMICKCRPDRALSAVYQERYWSILYRLHEYQASTLTSNGAEFVPKKESAMKNVAFAFFLVRS